MKNYIKPSFIDQILNKIQKGYVVLSCSDPGLCWFSFGQFSMFHFQRHSLKIPQMVYIIMLPCDL